MPSNDITLLNQLIADYKTKTGLDLPDSELFEIFVAENLLKNYDLSFNEIDEGIIGGGNDGGIDGIYCFVGGNLLASDTSLQGFREDTVIELVTIQAKQTPGFSEQAINRLIATLSDLLGDIEQPLSRFEKNYSSELLEIIDNYSNAVKELNPRFPRLRFSFFYATKGSTSDIHLNVKHRVAKLEETIRELFTVDDFSFTFMGARELKEQARVYAVSSLRLKVNQFIAEQNNCYVCLAFLKDYYDFITIIPDDGKASRNRGIFDANVREYEGAVEVNNAIRKTLASSNRNINFWWLNNGITIVVSRASISSRSLNLENPKVVNGLQTSQEIFEHFSHQSEIDDDRQILIRVIETRDENVKNSIIFASNNQTKVPEYSLHSTEQIHYDIELFFRHHDLYYDRQKNYYKNLGRPRKSIVTMQELAQAITAIILQEPNNSRGRPTDLVKKPEHYRRIFNPDYDMRVYFNAILLMRKIDVFFRDDEFPKFAQNDQRDIRFQLATFLVSLSASSTSLIDYVTQMSVTDIDDDFLAQCIHHVWWVFDKPKKDEGLEGHRISKNRLFDTKIIERVTDIVSGRTPMFFKAVED